MQIFLAIGNLGADPEVKYMNNGGAVVNVSLATTKKWTDRNSGERKEATEWHRLVAFNKTAEIIGEYAHKGSKLFVRGEVRTRKWQDRDGNDRYTTEVVVNEVELLTPKSGNGNGNEQRSQPQQNRQQPPHEAPPVDFDDDIPFD